MNDRPRKAVVTLAALLVPVLFAILVLLIVHLAGGGSSGAGETATTSGRDLNATAPLLAAGAPVPLVRLTDARSGAAFDTASLHGRPYAVTFLSSHCGAVVAKLRQAIAGLGPESSHVIVVAVTTDPSLDTTARVRRWLRAQSAPPGLLYLVGDEHRLRPYWRAWGVTPSNGSRCSQAAPLYLVDSAGRSAGVLYVSAQLPSSSLSRALQGLLKR